MFIKCIDNSLVAREGLVQDKIYEIDERRDIEINLVGERYFFVNGKRYGGWRFRQVPPMDAMLAGQKSRLKPELGSITVVELAKTAALWSESFAVLPLGGRD